MAYKACSDKEARDLVRRELEQASHDAALITVGGEQVLALRLRFCAQFDAMTDLSCAAVAGELLSSVWGYSRMRITRAGFRFCSADDEGLSVDVDGWRVRPVNPHDQDVRAELQRARDLLRQAREVSIEYI